MKPNVEQLKKAFECCKNNNGECPKECPLFDDTECTQTLGFYGLSLIHSYEQKIKELTEENERLMREKTALECIVGTARNQAKADTVRKMQEKVYEVAHDVNGIDAYWITSMIDQIAKELTDEN